MTPRKRRRKSRGAPPLDLSAGLGFPFRQEVPLSPELAPRATATARAVLESAGFEPIAAPRPEYGAPVRGVDPRVWVGERGLRRRGVTASTAVLPIIAVFVVGSILGGLDAYIVGSPTVGIFWVLGAAATSGVFWLRYGGTYDSELVMFTVSEPNSDPKSGNPSVVFWAARVRSQVRADVRMPSTVDGPLKLATEVGTLVREFRRRLVPSMAGPASGTALS